ncbi:MAG: MBL fold metallo-hydrolase, partial [Verrucomicrobiota bacterium]
MQLALEDNVEDVLGKAQRGLGISDEAICKESGLSTAQWQALLNGEPLTDDLRKVAPLLQLKPEPLIALAERRYRPSTLCAAGR